MGLGGTSVGVVVGGTGVGVLDTATEGVAGDGASAVGVDVVTGVKVAPGADEGVWVGDIGAVT